MLCIILAMGTRSVKNYCEMEKVLKGFVFFGVPQGSVNDLIVNNISGYFLYQMIISRA